jgi:threonine synthase
VAKAFAEGASSCEFWKDAETISSGLRVPKPYGDLLILKIVRESHGTVVTATDDQMMDAFRRWARVEGVFAAPEGAASLAAYQELLAAGFFKAEEKVVLFNTGSGLKYLDTIQQARMPKRPAARHIGGIIGPY